MGYANSAVGGYNYRTNIRYNGARSVAFYFVDSIKHSGLYYDQIRIKIF